MTISHTPKKAFAFAAFSIVLLSAPYANAADGLIGGLVQPLAGNQSATTTQTTGIVQPLIGNVQGTVGNITAPLNNAKLNGLVAPSSVNGNLITATTNKLNTTVGDVATLDLVGDGLTEVVVDKETAKLLTKQSQSAEAQADVVALTASQTEGVLDNVINTNGLTEARAVNVRNGVIVLGAEPKTGTVSASSTVDKDVTVTKSGVSDSIENIVASTQGSAEDAGEETQSFAQRIQDGIASLFAGSDEEPIVVADASADADSSIDVSIKK